MTILDAIFDVVFMVAAWGVALAWVTIACCCGYGGLVNSVLSYRGLLPLSRLTYCAYLVHPTIMMYTCFLLDGPFHLQNSMVVSRPLLFFTTIIPYILLKFIIQWTSQLPIQNLKLIS